MKLKDCILKPVELRRKPIATPEWGEADGQLYIRELTEAEFFQTQLEMFKDDPLRRAKHLVRILCDKDGNTVLDIEDAKALAEQRAGPVARIYGEHFLWTDELDDLEKKETRTKTTAKKSTT